MRMKFFLLSILVTFCVASPIGHSCEITSHTETEDGRFIEVACEDDMKYSLILQDKEGVSTLEVSGEEGGEKFNFLKIEHQVNSNNLYLTLQDKTFSVKDENSAEESAKLEELLTNPNFSSFSTAVQEVHDKLKLPGWKSPSTMFLYRIGMSLHHNLPSLKREEETVDEDILDYHGWFPEKECQQNGWKYNDVDDLIKKRCTGTCGPKCMMCWQWVCGDCCVHTGCLRHDKFCRGPYGKFHKDCVTFRGVLWDTITDTPYDC